MGSGNSKGAGGFRVFRIVQGGPASEAGLEIFFDFIVEVNGEVVESDKQSLAAMISDQEGKRVKLTVYNCRSQALRDVFVIPRRWQGQGLLGLVVKYDLMENGENQGLRILEVQPDSPGALCGLIEFKDFIIGSGDRIVRDGEDLGELVTTHIDQELALTLYNTDSETIREVTVVPKRDWGGEGLVGFSTGTGVLHRIPMARKPLVISGEASHAMPLEPTPSPDAEPASPNEPGSSPSLPELVAVGPPGSGPVSPKQKHVITLPIPQVSAITPARALTNPVVHSIATPVAEPVDSSPEVTQYQASVEQVLGVSVRSNLETSEPNVEELKKCVAEALGIMEDAPQEVIEADRSSFNGAVVDAFEHDTEVDPQVETVQAPRENRKSEPSPPVDYVEKSVTGQSAEESRIPVQIQTVIVGTGAELPAVEPLVASTELAPSDSVAVPIDELHAVHLEVVDAEEIFIVPTGNEEGAPRAPIDAISEAVGLNPLTVEADTVSERFVVDAPTGQVDAVSEAFGFNPSPERTPFGPVIVQPTDPFPRDPVREAFGLSPEPDPFTSQIDPLSQPIGSVSDAFTLPTGSSEAESSIAEAFGLVAPANSERRLSTESGVLVEPVPRDSVGPDISKLFD